MKQYRVEVKNSHEACEAQSLFWFMGYGKAYFSDSFYPKYVVTDINNNTAGASIGYIFGELITLNQLRTMAKKEYLDENHNLVHHKTDIEVPDGAEYAVKQGCAKHPVTFCKDGYHWSFNFGDWMVGELAGRDVVWQRMPSVDDEPTLGIKRIKAQPESVSIPVSELEKLGIVSPIVDVEDTVNHPTHYASGAVECIEAIEASMSPEAFKGFLKGNIIKYTWRYEQKGGAESLEKAQWYLNLLLSRVSS